MDPVAEAEGYVIDTALDNFVGFMREITDYGAASAISLKLGNQVHNLGRRMGINKLDERDTANHGQLLQGLMLTASWGALEAYVEDFCKSILAEDPTLIAGSAIAKLKTPVGDLFVEKAERINIVYRAMENAAGTRSGVNQFESLVKFLNLDAEVPDTISLPLFEAQKIRHVWAHKMGKADLKFVSEVPHLNIQVGERVCVDPDDQSKYFFSMITYGLILAGRYHLSQGREPISPEVLRGNPFYDGYKELFGMDVKRD